MSVQPVSREPHAAAADAARDAPALAKHLRTARLTVAWQAVGPAGTPPPRWPLNTVLMPLLRRRRLDRPAAARDADSTVIPFPERRRAGRPLVAGPAAEVAVFFDAWRAMALADLKRAIDRAADFSAGDGPHSAATLAEFLERRQQQLGVRFLIVLGRFEHVLEQAAAEPANAEMRALASQVFEAADRLLLTANFLIAPSAEARRWFDKLRDPIAGFDDKVLQLPLEAKADAAAPAPAPGPAPVPVAAPPRSAPPSRVLTPDFTSRLAPAARAAKPAQASPPEAAAPAAPVPSAEPVPVTAQSTPAALVPTPTPVSMPTLQAPAPALAPEPSTPALPAPSAPAEAVPAPAPASEPAASTPPPPPTFGSRPAVPAPPVLRSVVAVPPVLPIAPPALPVPPLPSFSRAPALARVRVTPSAGLPASASLLLSPTPTLESIPAPTTPADASSTEPASPLALASAPRPVTVSASIRLGLIAGACLVVAGAAWLGWPRHEPSRPAEVVAAPPEVVRRVALPPLAERPAPAVRPAPPAAAVLPTPLPAPATDMDPDAPMARQLALALGSAGAAVEVRAARGADDLLATGGPGAPPRLLIARYDALRAARAAAGGGAAPLQVIAPLYVEETQFFVRADSPLQFIHEIKGRNINVGPAEAGRAATMVALYQRLFGAAPKASAASALPQAAAFAQLVDDAAPAADRVEVVALVGGQPLESLATLPPESQSRLRLLRLDPSNAASQRALRSFLPANLRAGVGSAAAPVPTLSEMAFLVAPAPVDAVLAGRWAQALCQGLPSLEREGHPKWGEVQPGLVLDAGWPQSAPAQRVLEVCRPAR